MSESVSEIAEREAAEAEAETPDDGDTDAADTDDDGVGQSEAEPEQDDAPSAENRNLSASWTDDARPPAASEPPSDVEMERRFTKAEQRFATYQKAIIALWGDDAHHLTPFGLDPAAPLGFIDVRNAGYVEEDTKRAALEFLGFAREQDYNPDPDAHACETCGGKGKTKTGSLVAGRETRACPRCNGFGAIGLSSPTAGATTGSNGVATFSLAEPTTADAPDRDNWGEPRILPDGRPNVNYGRQPQFKEQVEPWGITAWLRPDGQYVPSESR